MLPYLAFALLTQTNDPVPTLGTGLEVAKLLGSIGYSFKATGEKSSSGEIAQGKAVARVRMARMIGDPKKGTHDRIAFFLLEVEFAASKPVDADEASAWPKTHTPQLPVSFTPHIGDTVTEEMRVELQKTSQKDLKTTLDAFFSAGKAFAKDHGTEFASLKTRDVKQTFDDKLTIDRADRLSFDRLVDSWGWTPKKAFGTASQGWMVQMEIKGKTLWIRQATKGLETFPKTVEIVRYKDEPAEEGYWQKAQASGDAFPSVVYDDRGPHEVATRESIDLSKGVSLGDLRRRIVAFAAN